LDSESISGEREIANCLKVKMYQHLITKTKKYNDYDDYHLDLAVFFRRLKWILGFLNWGVLKIDFFYS
jgi:hypothetical protein